LAVLEVGPMKPSFAGVERVDPHLPVGRPVNLDPSLAALGGAGRLQFVPRISRVAGRKSEQSSASPEGARVSPHSRLETAASSGRSVLELDENSAPSRRQHALEAGVIAA